LKGSKKRAKINSCKTKAVYNKSWLAEDSSEKKVLLNECWKLAKTCEETGSKLGYGKTCNELLHVSIIDNGLHRIGKRKEHHGESNSTW
jgi:hypothetical protein